MQTFVPQARTYIKLKMKMHGYTAVRVAEKTNTSIDTFKNFISGRTSKNPGFDAIINWILAVDGDIYECIGIEPPYKAEPQNIAEIKELYEVRIADMKEQCDKRVADMKEMADKRVADLIRFCDEMTKEE